MSLNSLYLDAFHACAQLGSFTKAAARLHITQSALSQRIKNLEEELGTVLMVRERAGARLTDFGERLVRYCRAKESAEAELVQEIQGPKKGGLSGIIRIGAFSTVARSVVLPALSELLSQNPGVQLKLEVRELYELPLLLRSGEIEFLLSTQTLNKPGLVSHRLGTEKNVLIQKKGYTGGDTFLDHDEEDTTTLEYFQRKSGPLLRHFMDDIYGIIDGVRLGVGRAVVPLHLVAGLPNIEIVNESKKHSVPIFLYYYEQAIFSRLHTAVVSILNENMKALK